MPTKEEDIKERRVRVAPGSISKYIRLLPESIRKIQVLRDEFKIEFGKTLSWSAAVNSLLTGRREWKRTYGPNE